MKNLLRLSRLPGLFACMCLLATHGAFAQDAAAPVLDTGSTAWMLTSSLLVLMMTLPGLALFYGGMVHKESVLATLMQAFVATTIVSVLWCVYGYSLIFTEGSGFIRGLSKIMMHGLSV